MTGDKVNEGSIWKGQDGRWYAQISYLGHRYQHKGSPNYRTVQVWLSRKKLQIATKIAEVNRLYEDAIDGAADFFSADLNHGPVQASVYPITKKRKSGTTYHRFCVEVQYLGQKIRKSSPSREVCEAFARAASAKINEIIVEANARREQIRREKDRELGKVGTDEMNAVIDLFREMKLEATAEAQPSLFGSTYVLLNPYSGFYKIGKTKMSVRKRISLFCTPEFEVVLVADGDIESEMHKAFHDKRLKGEWFRLDDKDIERLQKQYGFRRVSVIA